MKLLLLLGFVYAIDAQTCGSSQASSTPRLLSSYIVGGSNANSGDYPWQVGLVDDGYLICGGTYVTGNDGYVKVITAAHCVGKNARFYSVVFGMHRTTSTTGRLVIPADRVTMHSNYNSNTMANDIAVIEFGTLTHADLSSTFASPACLATRNYYGDEMALVSGWGTTTEGGSSSSTLKYVWKPILTYSDCDSKTGNAGYLDSTMMCAGDAGKDACQGDSGGPMVAYRNGAWELIGVVSWGFGCGAANYPGVYCDTWAMRSWIQNNI